MKPENFQKELFGALESQGVKIPPEYKAKIKSQMDQILNYQPKVGVFGKTGVGKSSLCNAVFGRNICDISDIEACTREPQEVLLSIGNKGIKLLDVPGVGENEERDAEYRKLYKKLLPELDLILWVLKGDDRAFSSDEEFYKDVVQKYIQEGTPFFIVINQVDKIEPFREWNEQDRRPGTKQAHNIAAKQRAVSGYFNLPIAQVLTVSANEKYNLIEFVDAIIHALPKDKKAIVLKEVTKENRSESAKQEAESGLLDTVLDIVLYPLPLPGTVKTLAKSAAKVVCSGLKKLWDWFW